jgi:hypothetical protein
LDLASALVAPEALTRGGGVTWNNDTTAFDRAPHRHDKSHGLIRSIVHFKKNNLLEWLHEDR